MRLALLLRHLLPLYTGEFQFFTFRDIKSRLMAMRANIPKLVKGKFTLAVCTETGSFNPSDVKLCSIYAIGGTKR